MNGHWIVLWFSMTLISPSIHCPGKCSCTNNTADILIDCTKLGITKFPPDEGFPGTEFLTVPGTGVKIDLSQNEITHAHFPSSWNGVWNINLTYNKITNIRNVKINDLASMKELDLSHNELENIAAGLESETLETLRVRECSISAVEEGILDSVPSLKLLDVSCNTLTELGHFCPSVPKVFDSQEEFPQTEPNRKHIQLSYLNASYNNIHKIHGRCLRHAQLVQLDLSGNRISNVKFTLYLPLLEELFMTENELKTLDGLSLPNLLVLDVSRNQLNDIHFDFRAKTPKLHKLDLSHNPIEEVSEIKSHSLLDLDLSYCRIRIIKPKALSSLSYLKRLNLIGNDLTYLHHEILMDTSNLEFLLLGYNPWECDCDSEEFKALSDHVVYEKTYFTGEGLICRNNKTWSEACKRDSNQDHLVVPERGAFYTLLYIFSALLTLITVTICYKCIRDARQSAAISLENRGFMISDGPWDTDTSPNNDRRDTGVDSSSETQFPPARRSTPPPNYEAALMLPELTEEQKEMAISTLSLHRVCD